MPHSTPTRRRGRGLVATLVVLAVLGVGGWFGVRYLAERFSFVLPMDPRCVASVNGQVVTITPEQAGNAAIIVGEAQRRGLAPRASSIALATAWQESGLRNLDYGDLDSVGLFQQRPSQGWGTAAQIMDPWYASGKFYEALVKIKGWETADLNDIAQQIQISAFPQAYRKHVPNARALASALTGETPASFTCAGTKGSGTPASAQAFVGKAFGGRVTVAMASGTVTLTGDATAVWSATHLVMAASGPSSVSVAGRTWTNGSSSWAGAASGEATSATLTWS